MTLPSFRYLSATFILCLIIVPGYGQTSIINCTDSTFCVPGVLGLPRSKGIEIKREIVRDYLIHSKLDGVGEDEAEVRRNRRWTFKLRAPVILKDNFKMAAGIKYFVEEYNFDDPNSLNPENHFYQNLEEKNLRSLRGEIFIVKPTRTNKYYILRISGAMNGDFDKIRLGGNYFKLSIAPLIGWKRSDYLSYAVGFAYSEAFGKRSIYPLFSYNQTFNQHWGVESILPAEVKLRYNTIDQKNFVYLMADLAGSNYTLDNFSNSDTPLYLEKSEVRFMINWEREIHDFLWFGLSAGYRTNIDFDLSESARINAKTYVSNDLNGALIYSMSIFVVPPRKMLK